MRALFLSQNYCIGASLRQAHFNQVENNSLPPFSFLEVTSEDFMDTKGRPRDILMKVRKNYPIALHGKSMNIGSAKGVNIQYLRKLRQLIEHSEPFIISDHLSWVASGDEYFFESLPLPRTAESLKVVVDNLDFVQNFLRRPVSIENVASYISFRDDEMENWEFTSEVLR